VAKRIFNHTWEYEKIFTVKSCSEWMLLELPFRRFEEMIIEETEEFIIKQEIDGRQRKYYRTRDFAVDHKFAVTCRDDWKRLKERASMELGKYFTSENISRIYGQYQDSHQKGDFSIRMNIEGFFWTSRELLGIEPQMFAFYDEPELIHDINQYMLEKIHNQDSIHFCREALNQLGIKYFNSFYDITK
jgi:hypothetical protein